MKPKTVDRKAIKLAEMYIFSLSFNPFIFPKRRSDSLNKKLLLVVCCEIDVNLVFFIYCD